MAFADEAAAADGVGCDGFAVGGGAWTGRVSDDPQPARPISSSAKVADSNKIDRMAFMGMLLPRSWRAT
jgi:hypothetical protein